MRSPADASSTPTWRKGPGEARVKLLAPEGADAARVRALFPEGRVVARGRVDGTAGKTHFVSRAPPRKQGAEPAGRG
jgi:hypothetical protein